MERRYSLHGLTLSLPFDCDEMAPAERGAAVDILVREGEVPKGLPAPIVHCDGYDQSADAFLWRGGLTSARFLVEAGRRITFQKNAGCNQPLFLHHLLYPVLAAALGQRQLLVLHASSAIVGAAAVLVTGESGAGKSTTVAALTARGWPLQSDDVSVLRVGEGDLLEVAPGADRLHLHEEAARRLSFDTQGLVRHDWHRGKMAVPALVELVRRPRPVRRIAFLSHAGDGPLVVERVTGWHKLALLLGSLYGVVAPQAAADGFGLFARALQDVEMLAIARPAGVWSLDAVIGAIADA